MAQNTKIDNKTINLTNSKQKKLRPGTTRLDAHGNITQMDTEGNVSLNGDLIIPQKRIFTDAENAIVVPNFEEGIKANQKVDEYNNSLFETKDSDTDNMILLGPKVLVRLYKLHLHASNGYQTGGRTQEIITDGMQKKKVQLSENMQFQDRGVVIKVSEDCVNKEKLKPGVIVDLDPVAFNPGRMQRWLHKENINNSFDNYFVIPEFIIENIITK